MSRWLFPVLLFVFFLLEGTVFQVFSPEWFGIYDVVIVPHLLFVALLFAVFFYRRSMAMGYALVFGFLLDIVYTELIGVYLFTLPFTVYVIGMLSRFFHPNGFVTFVFSTIGVMLVEIEAFIIYRLVGVAAMQYGEFFYDRLIVTLAINCWFAILFHFPFKMYFQLLKEDDDAQEDE